MQWFSGRLEATCIRGRHYVFHDVSFARAQQILDEQFEDRLREAIYHPASCSMEAAVKEPIRA